MQVRRVYQDVPGFAAVCDVRIETMIKNFDITIDQEFDESDGLDTRYVLLSDGRIPVAECRLHGLNGYAKIERVSVLTPYQKKGVGSKLLQEAEKWLKELGYRHVVITSREEALPFYLKNGYALMNHEKEGSGIFTCVYVDKMLGGNE